jgi:hypothetical protein
MPPRVQMIDIEGWKILNLNFFTVGREDFFHVIDQFLLINENIATRHTMIILNVSLSKVSGCCNQWKYGTDTFLKN